MTKVTRGFCWHQNFVPWGCLPLTCGYIHLLNQEKMCIKSEVEEILFKLATNDHRTQCFFLLTANTLIRLDGFQFRSESPGFTPYFVCPAKLQHIWAASWQNQQNGLRTHWRLRSAWASAQSDQSSLSAWKNLGSLTTHWAHSEDTDQTGRKTKSTRAASWQNQQNGMCAQRRLRVWSVLAVSMKKPWVLSYPLSRPGWSESLLGAHSFCWFCHVTAHLQLWGGGYTVFTLSISPSVRDFLVFQYLEKAMMLFHKVWQTHWCP